MGGEESGNAQLGSFQNPRRLPVRQRPTTNRYTLEARSPGDRSDDDDVVQCCD